MAPSLHPILDSGITKGDGNFAGGKLYCHCKTDPVEVTLAGNVLHNRACGCSKCWKPAGALFSVAAVIPSGRVSVTAHGDKLAVVDADALIVRHACRDCGVHMYGRVEQPHAFQGLDFVHVELSGEKGWQEPQFASFVSSIIEHGYDPKAMDEIRGRFKELGLETYDCLPPALMDAIATFVGQQAGNLPA
jgi:S-(hydroxymethyl)glutathione synthase